MKLGWFRRDPKATAPTSETLFPEGVTPVRCTWYVDGEHRVWENAVVMNDGEKSVIVDGDGGPLLRD